MTHQVTLIPGDWIGPETTASIQQIIAAAGVNVQWESFPSPVDDVGDVLPEVLESARSTGVILQNRTAARRDTRHLPPTLQIRKALGMWAQVRFAQNLPGLPSRFSGVNIAVVRELAQGVYTGLEHETAAGVYEQVRLTTESACERIARFAFEQAVRWSRKKITIVHKSNILKMSDGLFLHTAQRVALDYPDITCDEVIVDALCMRLVRWPQSFDVLLCGSLFGDIVADLVAGLAGGICMGGGTSYGESVVMFENPHGKAPELVGRGLANPIPMLIPAVNLLHHVGEKNAAKSISSAMKATLTERICTADVGGTANTAQVTAAIIDRL